MALGPFVENGPSLEVGELLPHDGPEHQLIFMSQAINPKGILLSRNTLRLHQNVIIWHYSHCKYSSTVMSCDLYFKPATTNQTSICQVGVNRMRKNLIILLMYLLWECLSRRDINASFGDFQLRPIIAGKKGNIIRSHNHAEMKASVRTRIMATLIIRSQT